MSTKATIRSRQGVAALASHLGAPEGIVGDAVNATRFLAVDAVERAGSGHSGTAMALAPLAHRSGAVPSRPRAPRPPPLALPAGMPSVATEAGSPQGWREFVDDVIGLDHFGASAPAAALYHEFAITAEVVSDRVRTLIGAE